MGFIKPIITSTATREIARQGDLVFTKIAIGTGVHTNPIYQNGLSNKVYELSPTIERGYGWVRPSAWFKNTQMNREVVVKEIGVFARVGNGSEFMYAYTSNSSGDHIQAPSVGEDSREYGFTLGYTREGNVTVSYVSNATGVSAQTFNEHTLNRNNPHGVTKEQLGLSATDISKLASIGRPIPNNDVHQITEPGTYWWDNSTANRPGSGNTWGVIQAILSNRTVKDNTNWMFLIAYTTRSANIDCYVKKKINADSWTAWLANMSESDFNNRFGKLSDILNSNSSNSNDYNATKTSLEASLRSAKPGLQYVRLNSNKLGAPNWLYYKEADTTANTWGYGVGFTSNYLMNLHTTPSGLGKPQLLANADQKPSNNTDFNNLIIPGNYYIDGNSSMTTMRNRPCDVAGRLVVTTSYNNSVGFSTSITDTEFVYQEFTRFDNGHFYRRVFYKYENRWYPWKEYAPMDEASSFESRMLANNEDLNNIFRPGTYGATTAVARTLKNAYSSGQYWEDAMMSVETIWKGASHNSINDVAMCKQSVECKSGFKWEYFRIFSNGSWGEWQTNT